MKFLFRKTKQSEPDLRQSFSLPFNGGGIWVVCLDNLEDNTELIKEKIINNEKLMGRPSSSALVLYHLDGTKITAEIANLLIDSLTRFSHTIKKLAFVGISNEGRKSIKSYLAKSGMEFNIPSKYFSSLDLAKEWLVSEKY